MKILEESLSPEVGPFYVIDNVVFADTESVKELKLQGKGSYGFIDSDNDHYHYWKLLQRLYPEYRRIDYDYYPRGRVVYNLSNDMYYLYVDQCIKEEDRLIDEIIKELGLPYNKVQLGLDEHYQCHNCNSEYSDIFENYFGG